MKSLSAMTVVLLMTQTSMAMTSDRVACVLVNVPLASSPVAIIDTVDRNSTIKIYENSESYNLLLPEAAINDKSDDVLYFFKNKAVSLSFFGDESDRMDLMSGQIKSAVMSGDIKCKYID